MTKIKIKMERIHVAVRSRPLSVEEANGSPWRISGNSIFIPNQSTKFQFDTVFGEDCSTTEIYRARTKDIVAAAVSGFNGTVFAYGQTNSGKTYTMRGTESEPGVIPLAVRDLFNVIYQDMDREFLLRMSYMEIYNEEINDLLAPEHRKLQIHENLERGIYVTGLREEIVASPEQVLDLMRFGESHRHIGETNMNLYSSRSHTIFRMIIESRNRSEDESNGNSCDAVRVSVLNLVDLAGSERAAKTGAEGVRLKEGSHINKSLMTLGTVIKKLSEGAESQGGHVPYRDSKLTRILQPALGGNANTAMICNITLAQIHADETKSSLQFASRALRVTNCARVNEILTDAALLKRQKREIEELRAKLQASHSEHLEEEILNLRNTLLQTELERERIALELEEEKKTQAEWEKRVKEQAKKIENLSSMVLFSNRDETHERIKKDKRRDTWCPGNLAKEALNNAYSTLQPKASDVKTTRYNFSVGPLLPFEELMNESDPMNDYSCKQDNENGDTSNTLEKCSIPDPCTLLHVTSRRKPPPKRKNSSMEEPELIELQTEYENLLLHSEMQRIMNEIHIDCLTAKLEEAHSLCPANFGGNNVILRESDAILVIKRLQDQINMLEMESSSSQQNLDSVVELATEQNICARNKLEELYDELLKAKEEAKLANEKLSSGETKRDSDEVNHDFILHVSTQVQDMMSEVQKSEETIQSVYSLVDEVFYSYSMHLNLFQEFKTSLSHTSAQQNLIRSDFQKFSSYSEQRVTELEDKKIILENQLDDLQEQIRELKLNAQNSQNSLKALLEQHDLEKEDLVSYSEALEKELSSLSSWSKEKENSRKELDKMKTKLKETDSKLKIAIQEKTKLEGEKACADREIKRLHSQNTLLERDISKREPFVGNRRDSIMDKGSKLFDSKKSKDHAVALEQTLQEEYKKMEILAFESETKIASLEEELEFAYREKGEMSSTNENLVSEVANLTEMLQISNSQLNKLHEEVSELRKCLEESNVKQHQLESSFKALLEEKEELAMHLTDCLLEMEEERAIWSAKDKASIQAVEEKSRSYKEEIEALSTEILQVKTQLDSCRGECNILKEMLNTPNTSAELKNRSYNDFSELGQKKNDITKVCTGDQQSLHIPESSSEMLLPEQDSSSEKLKLLRENGDTLPKEWEDLSTQIEELDTSEDLNDIKNMKEQILVMANEKDSLMSLNKQLENRLLEVERLQKLCNDELLEKSSQVDELARKNTCLEISIREAESESNKVITKLRMRLRGTQTKLDAFRIRYIEAIKESDLMNKKFEEAAAKLKDRLAAKAIEVLNLKKQLSDAKGQ